jgi:hypothetical protein
MQMIARLLLLASCCAVLFIAGVLATFQANILISGAEEFNGNAGGGFAVLMEGIFIGFALALCRIPLSIFLSKRIRWLRDSNGAG